MKTTQFKKIAIGAAFGGIFTVFILMSLFLGDEMEIWGKLIFIPIGISFFGGMMGGGVSSFLLDVSKRMGWNLPLTIAGAIPIFLFFVWISLVLSLNFTGHFD